MSNNTNVSNITVKVENLRKINVDVYKNHEATPTRNLSPGDRATFSTPTAGGRDSEVKPQFESLQFESCGFVYNPRCDIRYQEKDDSNDLHVQPLRSETPGDQLLREGDGDDKPVVNVTLGQDEPPTLMLSHRCRDASFALIGSSIGVVAAPFIYNASTTWWGITLAASVIGGIVSGLIYRAKQKGEFEMNGEKEDNKI